MGDYAIGAVQELDLHHLYRAMAWLGEELSKEDQEARTYSPRCVKDVIEEELFFRSRNLFLISIWFSLIRLPSSLREKAARLLEREAILKIIVLI